MTISGVANVNVFRHMMKHYQGCTYYPLMHIREECETPSYT